MEPFNYPASCGTLKARDRHERRNGGLPWLNWRLIFAGLYQRDRRHAQFHVGLGMLCAADGLEDAALGRCDRFGTQRDRLGTGGISRSADSAGNPRHHRQGIGRAVRLALLEVAFDGTHLVRHMGEAYDVPIPGPSECIESGGFHLDRQNVS